MFSGSDVNKSMMFRSFHDYLIWQAGLWLNDDKAIGGLSKLPTPRPKEPLESKGVGRPAQTSSQNQKYKNDFEKVWQLNGYMMLI